MKFNEQYNISRTEGLSTKYESHKISQKKKKAINTTYIYIYLEPQLTHNKQ